MKETLSLSRVGHPDEIGLVLDVDVESGTITGEDTEIIQSILDEAKGGERIRSRPDLASYPYTGNFKTDLARVLVGEGYVLPDDWMAAAKLAPPWPVKDGVVY